MSLNIRGVDFNDGRSRRQGTSDTLVSEEGFGIFGTGIQGLTGLIGTTGLNIGAQGGTGISATGIQGFTGFIGIVGSTGIVGGIGQTGIRGPTGSGTIPGVPGLNGFTGLEGATGIIGTTGIEGITGPRGITGLTLQGLTGFQGLTGVGLQGFTGLQGATGLTGATGIQGATGISIQGATGISGQTISGATGLIQFRFVDYQQQTSGATILATIPSNTLQNNDALEWSAWGVTAGATTLLRIEWGGQLLVSQFFQQIDNPIAINGWITRTGNNSQQTTTKALGVSLAMTNSIGASVDTTVSNTLILSLTSGGVGHNLYAIVATKLPGTA